MFALWGYHLSEKVYENNRTVIYRGIREDDKLPVLVRLLKPEHPRHEEFFFKGLIATHGDGV